nr:huntingtin interacting protein 1 [Hymenolepis microstoma]
MLSIGRTPESLNAFAVALLDYLETLLKFQSLVLATFDRSEGSSSSLSSQCRLAALTQCIQDCAALYDLSLKALIKLHALLPPESLTSSRDRFYRLYTILERFFLRANTFAYIRDILKIPSLPSVQPNLLDNGNGVQSIGVVEIHEDEVSNPLIDLTSEDVNLEQGSWKGDDVDAIFDLSPETSSSSAFGASKKSNAALEVESLRAEMQRIQLEKSIAHDQLVERIRTMENETKALVDVKLRQDDQLSRLVEEVKAQTALAAANEEKFIKFRDAYGKLRGDYVGLLQQMESVENSNEMKQRLMQLESEQVTWQDTKQQLEKQLADARLSLEAAESRSTSLTGKLESSRRTAERETCDLLLKAACVKAKQDVNSIIALINNSEFVQCRSCADVVNQFIKSANAEIMRLKDTISDREGKDFAKLPLNIAHLSSCLNDSALHAKAIANSAADIVKSDELTANCRRILNNSLEIYSHLFNSSALEEWRRTELLGQLDSVTTALSRIQVLAEELRPHIKDINEEDLASALEREMQHTAELIARAEARFRELLEQSKISMTGIQLEVHSKILGTCTELMSAIALLVARARELQMEIVNEGRGTATIKEFYKRHNRWTEGLYSAAKSVGAGANLLVESADDIISNKTGQLERLTVAALEISSSTTQLLVASRIKASESSQCLNSLEIAAKSVSKVTGEVVAEVQNASTVSEQSQNMDFAQLSYTQAHKTEVDSQVRVLELEAQLMAERKRLAEIRRFNYSNSAEFEQKH